MFALSFIRLLKIVYKVVGGLFAHIAIAAAEADTTNNSLGNLAFQRKIIGDVVKHTATQLRRTAGLTKKKRRKKTSLSQKTRLRQVPTESIVLPQDLQPDGRKLRLLLPTVGSAPRTPQSPVWIHRRILIIAGGVVAPMRHRAVPRFMVAATNPVATPKAMLVGSLPRMEQANRWCHTPRTARIPSHPAAVIFSITSTGDGEQAR